jgi:hypothetical protein
MPGADPPSPASTPDGETPSRRYPRLRCFVAVSLRAKGPDLFFMGNLSTMGLGGCGVERQTPVETGMRLEIVPLENERLSVIGNVVDLRILSGKPGYGIGIEFPMRTSGRPSSLNSSNKRLKSMTNNTGTTGRGQEPKRRNRRTRVFRPSEEFWAKKRHSGLFTKPFSVSEIACGC